ncbi:MAG: M23 family metallopeptidase [Oscillospiraceae bacterium]|nr:M23 family metallopeptidase [Oscillospiraceae bacterium]
MKKNLFGVLGGYIKGNAVIIILALATVAAGALSFYTIKDINDKLDSQSFENPNKVVQQPESETESEDARDVNNGANNVPLKPSATAKPRATAAPKADSEAETADAATEAEGVEKPKESEPADKFILPLDGKIVAAFSGDELVYNTTMGDWRTHNGIDIKATKDTAVKACADGTVSKIYNDGMLGWVVEVKTDDWTTRYCGLNEKVFVKEGKAVKQGDSIGTVGEIPLETTEDSHLHLEVVKNGQCQDPDEYLKK